jgi:glycosyltransferase involved in cell wall biosynthesis
MLPLISCLMPTCDRREFIPQALACFEAQTYPHKQLVIVDNGQDSIQDLAESCRRVIYKHVGTEKLSTGEMRNRACALATGTIFCHWDDDDYSHPKRMVEQFRMMQSMSVSLVGYNAMYFLDEEQQQAWLYSNPEFYALGTSLMYTKDYWRGGKFPDLDVAEDSAFIERAQYRRAMSVGVANDRLIARIHGKNTCDKRRYMLPPMWTETPYEFVRSMMP